MADRLITTSELATYMQLDTAPAGAGLLIELATGEVQGAARQRLIQATDSATVLGTCSPWLTLPERPVTAIISVTIDGTAVTDYIPYADQLWRAAGWRTQSATTYRPYSTVAVAYTHGWPDGHYKLGTARTRVLALCAKGASNPTDLEAVAIDDYRESRGNLAERLGMTLTKEQQRELRVAYRRIAGTT